MVSPVMQFKCTKSGTRLVFSALIFCFFLCVVSFIGRAFGAVSPYLGPLGSGPEAMDQLQGLRIEEKAFGLVSPEFVFDPLVGKGPRENLVSRAYMADLNMRMASCLAVDRAA